MDVKIARIDKTIPLPIYETTGAVGFDFLARETTEIKAGEIKLIPGNVVVETPPGYMLAVASRSSTPRKKGLTMPHGFGVIDQDYSGPEDEIKIQVRNFKDENIIINKGEKIAQGIFIKIEQAQFIEVESMKGPSRGGFGSTDNK